MPNATNPPTFICQEMKPLPPEYDKRLPTPPPPSPCDYGCPRIRICKDAQECCRTYRTYESSGMKYFKDWDKYLMADIRPLAGRTLHKYDQEYST